MFAIEHNIPKIKDKLLRLRKLVGKSPNWQDEMTDIAEQAASDLKRLTPRSEAKAEGTWSGKKKGGRSGASVWKEKHKHVADGWRMRHIGKSGKDRVPVLTAVWNDFTHKWTKNGLTMRNKAKLRTAGGVTKPYTLLEILEYGTPAHTIEPAEKGFRKLGRSGAFSAGSSLYFKTKSGEWVFAKRVRHPGTRPYGMVRIVRAKTKTRLMKLGNKWLRKLEDEWKRG